MWNIKNKRVMTFAKESVIKSFFPDASFYEACVLFKGSGYKRSDPKFVYLGQDLNEPEDVAFYSDRFARWCDEAGLEDETQRQVKCSVFSNNIWYEKESAEKVISCYCLAKKMMDENDKVVVTSIIRLVNKSNGFDCFYITYRIDKGK